MLFSRPGLILRSALVALLCASPAIAQSSFVAFNGLQVRGDPQKPGAMEVYWRSKAGPVDFWCAAGDYATQRLGASATDRLYLLNGASPSRISADRRATSFTIVPEPGFENGRRPGDNGNYSLSVTEPGYNLRVAHARSFCLDSRQRLRGFGLF